MKSKTVLALSLPEDKLKQKNKVACFTHYYEFFLLDGAVFARDKRNPQSLQQWKPLLEFKPHINLPDLLHKLLEEKKVIAITADESNFNLVVENGRVYYAKLDDIEGSIEWIEHWGLVNKFKFKERVIYADPARYKFISSSHCPPYKGRPDGKNIIQGCLFGISGLYAYDIETGYIVFSDPWWLSEFGNRVSPPNGKKVIGMSVSASTILIVTEDGMVYTLLVDFDTGDNRLLKQGYSLVAMEDCLHPELRQEVEFNSFVPATGMSLKLLKDITRKRNLPLSIWSNHIVPNEFTALGSVTILQKGPNIRDDFELRVWGVIDGQYGYIRKLINQGVDNWVFKPNTRKFQPECQECINPVATLQTRQLMGAMGFLGRSWRVPLSIANFNPYKDYNVVEVTLGQTIFYLYLFLVSQVHIKNQTYARGVLMLSTELKNSKEPQVQSFVRDYFGKKDVQELTIKRKDDTWKLSAKKLRLFDPLNSFKLKFQEQSPDELKMDGV